jgi:polyribonucleotide nucleotidyltransferase
LVLFGTVGIMDSQGVPMNKAVSVTREIGGKTLTLESGKMARQANGSVLVSYGDTRVLVTVCSAKEPKIGIDFMPLTVEFAERYYAAGKIPGSFHKREGRPTQEATLSSRMIDRPIRPLFPEGYHFDTQVVATVLSVDHDADVDMAAAAGASAALHISDIPFAGPTAACRVGRIKGEITLNPSWHDIEQGETDFDVLVAGTKDAIMMIEGGAKEVTEEDLLQGILKAHEAIKEIASAIEELRTLTGAKPKRAFAPEEEDASLMKLVEQHSKKAIESALRIRMKASRSLAMSEAKKALIEALASSRPETAETDKPKAFQMFENIQYSSMRSMILSEKTRIDGRNLQDIRPITVEAGILPRAHGSGLFTRGETQVLAAVTLGTSDDEQIVDTMFQDNMKKFMLHYNFAPYCVGETGRMGGQSRREIGHGALAERAIKAMMPQDDSFPYTLRIVCETLESNGSSSMASVCSSSVALMDAGIPFPKPVAGIAMGLIKEGNQYAVLSDILGDEDHLGDMDFKVAGTKEGVTAIQMDIKIKGVTEAIMRDALAHAKQGRMHILGEMAKIIEAPREEMSPFAPRITTLKVPVDRIREVIGSGGKVVKDIIAQTGCKVDINDDGTIHIASADGTASKRAIAMIEGILAVAEVGQIYKGTVKRVVEFGAFIGILPNQDGLLHVSEIAHERVQNVEDHLKEGDLVEVKVLEIDRAGKIRLSRKALIDPPEGGIQAPKGTTPRPPRPEGRDRNQRPRPAGGPPRHRPDTRGPKR